MSRFTDWCSTFPSDELIREHASASARYSVHTGSAAAMRTGSASGATARVTE